MKRLEGYHWAVTGAAATFCAVVSLKFSADVWAAHSGLELWTNLASVVFVAALFGLFGWGMAFLTLWPLFLLTMSLAEVFRTRSALYFITCGALTGALVSALLLVLPRETSDERSFVEVALWVVPTCVVYGVSGAWLFWWKVIRPKPAESSVEAHGLADDSRL